MSYTERMVERLQVVGVISAYNTAAATGATGATCDMGDARRALINLVGNGTGTAYITVQEGQVTVSSNPTTGEITAEGVDWGNLIWDGETSVSGATGQVTATGYVTKGQLQQLEVKAASMSANHRYLRTLLNTGSAQTYASVIALLDVHRYEPASDDSAVKEPIVIGDNPFA